MAANIRAGFKVAICMGRGHISGQTDENIKGITSEASWKAMATSYGLMDERTKANSRMTRKVVTEFSIGVMGESLKVIG